MNSTTPPFRLGIVFILVLTILAAGCASQTARDHPPHRARPSADRPPDTVGSETWGLSARGALPPGGTYSVVSVLYATDRTRLPDDGESVRFGAGRNRNVEYGECLVSIPSTHREGELESPSLWRFEFREDPEKHVVLLAVTPAKKDAYLADLSARVRASPQKTALVFVHGYNVTFEDAARRTAQIAFDIHFSGVPIFFSWPSLGSVTGYPIDMTNADWAQFDLKAFLLDLADTSDAENIILIAHSMGNRVLTRALVDAVAERPAFASRVREVVLAAPDIDAETFRRDLAPRLIAAARGTTMYASSTDAALNVSHQYNGEARAGDIAAGPIVVIGMETVDVSAVDPGPLGHSYIGDSPSVLDDIAKLIDNGQRAAARLGNPVTGPQGSYWRMAPSTPRPGGSG